VVVGRIEPEWRRIDQHFFGGEVRQLLHPGAPTVSRLVQPPTTPIASLTAAYTVSVDRRSIANWVTADIVESRLPPVIAAVQPRAHASELGHGDIESLWIPGLGDEVARRRAGQTPIDVLTARHESAHAATA
jgi:hypothetical protein